MFCITRDDELQRIGSNNEGLLFIFTTEESGSRVPGCGHRIMAITSAFQADDAGSIPAARSRRADMAQLVERTLGKGEVPSSTLGISTTSLLLPVSLCLLLKAFNSSGILPG